jgi:hypothetical protein
MTLSWDILIKNVVFETINESESQIQREMKIPRNGSGIPIQSSTFIMNFNWNLVIYSFICI